VSIFEAFLERNLWEGFRPQSEV